MAKRQRSALDTPPNPAVERVMRAQFWEAPPSKLSTETPARGFTFEELMEETFFQQANDALFNDDGDE